MTISPMFLDRYTRERQTTRRVDEELRTELLAIKMAIHGWKLKRRNNEQLKDQLDAEMECGT
jgi:hypothetical protein